MTVEVSYIACDGTIFDTKFQCLEYEKARITECKKLIALDSNFNRTESPEEISESAKFLKIKDEEEKTTGVAKLLADFDDIITLIPGEEVIDDDRQDWDYR